METRIKEVYLKSTKRKNDQLRNDRPEHILTINLSIQTNRLEKIHVSCRDCAPWHQVKEVYGEGNNRGVDVIVISLQRSVKQKSSQVHAVRMGTIQSFTLPSKKHETLPTHSTELSLLTVLASGRREYGLTSVSSSDDDRLSFFGSAPERGIHGSASPRRCTVNPPLPGCL